MLRQGHLILLFILVLATCLRLYQLDTHGIYFDEKVTLLVSQAISPEGSNQPAVLHQATFTPKDFWREKNLQNFNEAVARGDWGNSPLHYLFLNTWIDYFGLSDFAVRCSSVFWSILLIWMLFKMVRYHFKDDSLALVVAFLAAIEPFFIAQSHIVRNYSMTLFLTVWATHTFLKIVAQKNPSAGLYRKYGFIAAAALLSHYLAFPIVICHGVYVLLKVRDLEKWVKLIVAMLIPAICLTIWMTWGGGKYSLKTMSDVGEFYRNIALHPPTPNPYKGMIDFPTLPNVLFKFVPVLSDLFILTNHIGETMAGTKNLLVCIIVVGLWFWLYKKYNRRESKYYFALMILLHILAYILYSVAKIEYLTLSVVLFLLLVLFTNPKKQQGNLYLLLWIGVVIPIIMMLWQAQSAGHTFSINQRYLAFSIPFALILCASLIEVIGKLPVFLRLCISGVLVWQTVSVGMVLKSIYNDNNAKYIYFVKERLPNPFITTAQLIDNYYQKGDTVVYPSNNAGTYSDIQKSSQRSVFEAQLVNLYLSPKAQYVQRIDAEEQDKVKLIRKNGTVLTLIDWKDKRY